MSPTIRASAPARIDLAGGTLDIWPLCHLLDAPAVTVNVAIDLRAEVEVEERSDGFVEIVSEDLGESVRLPVDGLQHDRLGLATRLVEWFDPGDGLFVRLRARAPPRAGLGGSSAMAVALTGALAGLRGAALSPEAMRGLVQNLETAQLGTPTGYQDYYPALYGGVSVLEARPDAIHHALVPDALDFLADHLRLVNTRIDHHSGLTNWEVVWRFLDGDKTVRASLNEIARCAARVRDAVAARNAGAMAAAMADEWRQRRNLSPVVTNARIEAIVEELRKRGALAAKICGAGGGGCLAVVVPGDREVKLDAPVAFAPDPRGLTLD